MVACILNSTLKSYFAMVGLQDFDSREHLLQFPGSRSYCLRCRINITNDDINEASEELFIFQLTLAQSLNPNLITLSRNASIGIIEDDDRKLDETEIKMIFPLIIPFTNSYQDWIREANVQLY